jgi:hypothetical protein
MRHRIAGATLDAFCTLVLTATGQEPSNGFDFPLLRTFLQNLRMPPFFLQRRLAMKRALLVAIALTLCIPAALDARPQRAKKRKVPCAADLAHCPDQGCGTDFDEHLNEAKNTTANGHTPEVRTLAFIKKLDDPEIFMKGGTREELQQLGEGDMVSVAAYVIAVKPELGGESCNCGLQTREETDNHLVLVTSTTVDKFTMTGNAATQKKRFHSRELESVTAEFTPRVRPSHPHFTREFVQPFINNSPKKAILARVTGPLLFDSEHFLHNPLVRVTDWEIHPIFKFEICMGASGPANNCKADSDTGWKDVDDMH